MNAINQHTENSTNQNLQEQAPQKAVWENIEATATYSAEDNKLRLYFTSRLDKNEYKIITDSGFKWAPKQELFVAPRWTPNREDLCIEIAGEITAEQSTILERAELKAERLDNLAMKRSQQANAFHQAASRISERFAGGQPILIGHHSERKARRDQSRMDAEMRKAVAAQKAVSYWNYKAAGVEHHANRKNNAGVRSRRIKTLLTELRDRQRAINHAHICFALWSMIDSKTDLDEREKLIKHYSGAQLKTGSAAPYLRDGSLWSLLEDEKITHEEVLQKCLNFHDYQSNNPYTLRWINHILNRLAFERSELGEVSRFDGEITATILQAFAREQGAHSPKATKTPDGWSLSSSVVLPLHISDTCDLTQSTEAWINVMQESGYEVPARKPKQPPILNFKAPYLKGKSWGGLRTFRQIELTKAEYSTIYSDYRCVKLSECGEFKFKVCKNPEQRGYDAEWCAVFLSDSKIHDAPESESITHNIETA